MPLTPSQSQVGFQKILVYLKHASRDARPVLANFTQCILDYFCTDHQTEVHLCLKNNSLILSNEPMDKSQPVILQHPPFCPIMKIDSDIHLEDEIMKRGIDVGVAVLLESSDNRVLLTRRAPHMRSFPGIWVPPGGHIEENETLLEAAMRELCEETGLKITPELCEDNTLDCIGLWESVYPAKLRYGLPNRHHLVVYLHRKLKNLSWRKAEELVQLQPTEVDASAWLDRRQIECITYVDEACDSNFSSDSSFGISPDSSPSCSTITANATTTSAEHILCMAPPTNFRVKTLNENNKMVYTEMPFTTLLQRADDESDINRGRVSTGTKFALRQWLSVCPKDPY
ncbi:hypothetical protein Ahia01_001202200 [Argonauta hians]